MQTRSNIILWGLYDFANSIISIVFFFYFTQWVVVDQGIADIWLNLTFTAAAVLLIFTVPFAGSLLDKFFRRIVGLRISTIFTIIFFTLCAISVLNGYGYTSLVFFSAGLYAYLLTFTFYTSFINDIAKPEKIGKVSGFGIAANYFGQLTGLVIALPFAQGELSLFNAEPRAETLVPCIIIFAVLSLPMLIFFKEPKRAPAHFDVKEEVKVLWNKSKHVLLYPGVALFILAYFLFNDAILTASTNFSIFLEQVWGVSDTIKTYIMAGILITSAFGGIISGLVADKFGHKRTLLFITCGWLVILPLIAFLENFALFVTVTTLMGFWFGANWAVSRSVMAYLAPQEGRNLAFAYFGLIERASAFVGPLVWGGTLALLVNIGPDRYRYATLAVTTFIFFGLIALIKVRSDRPKVA